MARLREGRANTARGAAHFLRETVGRVRYAGIARWTTHGAGRQRLLHPRHESPPAAGWMSASPSPSARVLACAVSSRPYPAEQDWTPIPYWMDGAADVAETSYTPFQSKPDAIAGAAHRPAV